MKSFIAVDLETTGLGAHTEHIIEIGALKYVDGECVETFSKLVKPPVSISYKIYQITGIDDQMVEGENDIAQVFSEFCDFVGEEEVLLGHNLNFDYSFLKAAAENLGMHFEKKGIDTLKLAKTFLKELPKKNLGAVSSYYGVLNPRAHRAYEDAETTAKVYLKMCEEFAGQAPEKFQPQEMQVKLKKVEPMTLKQKNYLNDLMKYHRIQGEAFLQEKGFTMATMTKSQASKLIDGIISTYGRIRR